MSKRVKLWLIVWGVLAFIALKAPSVVVIGSFLIVPGLILIAAPTIFLYSAVFVLLRRLLPLHSGWALNLSAGALALVLGWLVAQPWALVEHYNFARANLPEVLPAAPVRLGGNIRLELPGNSLSIKDHVAQCGALCAALLDTPNVTGVMVAATDNPAQVAPLIFRLVPRNGDRSRGLYPVNPEAILDDLTQEPWTPRDVEVRREAMKLDKQAVAAAWGLRLASRQKLVAEPAATSPDITIRITEDRFSHHGILISRVEILGRNGTALMRKSIVTGSALSAPLRFNGVGGLENFRVQLDRDHLSSKPKYPYLKPVSDLFRYSTLARPEVDSGMTAALLKRLRSATANSALAPDDPDFGLAELWIPTIDWRRAIPPDQLFVLERVISDERVPLPPRLYDGYESKVAPELRRALGSRIRKPSTPSETRTQLARLLSKMPDGTFAKLSPDEEAILDDEELRADAYPMIVRLADQGEPAVHRLLAILKSDTARQHPFRAGRVIQAVGLSFATLGPRAHAALPEVDAIVNAESSPVFGDSTQRRIWNLALARMGKPIDEFTWTSNRAEFVERQRENLRKQVARFDPKDVWKY